MQTYRDHAEGALFTNLRPCVLKSQECLQQETNHHRKGKSPDQPASGTEACTSGTPLAAPKWTESSLGAGVHFRGN